MKLCGNIMDINKIYNGDCIEEFKKLEDKSIDCVITSPPYWKGFAYESYFNSYKQYLDWSYEWMKEVKRVLKDDGTFFLNVANDSETTVRAFELMQIATNQLMFKLHDTIIWYRYNQQPANTDRQLTNQCEFIFMFRKFSSDIQLNKKDVYLNNPELFKTKNVGNVWELPFNKDNKSNKDFGRKETGSKWGHNGFPIALPESCILLATKEGDIVLDPFIGSGTTAIASLKHNRNFIGFELNEEYCKLANDRVAENKNTLLSLFD